MLQDVLFFIFITFLLPAMLRNARRAGMKVMKNNPPGTEKVSGSKSKFPAP